MCCLIQGLGRHILRYTTNINTSEKCHSYADGNGTFQKCMPKEPAPRAPKVSGGSSEAPRPTTTFINTFEKWHSHTGGNDIVQTYAQRTRTKSPPKVRGRSLEAPRPTTNIFNKCQKWYSHADGNATCQTSMPKEPAPRAHPKSEVEAYNPTLFSSLMLFCSRMLFIVVGCCLVVWCHARQASQ